MAPPRVVPGPNVRLSERERQVLKLIAEGLTSPEIARKLRISPHTVRSHIENACRRMGVYTRSAAVFRAAVAGALGEVAA